jgi:glycosyltransferase involved in cell wall biosynthesis
MRETRQTDGPGLDATVIIPCVKAPLVALTLDSIAAQQTAYSYEVLVVGTDDFGTLRARNDIRFIDTGQPRSAGANRNIAIREARGRYLLFTDADCRVAPDWLAILVARLAEGYRMVGGAIDFPKSRFWATGDNMAILHDLSPGTPGGEVTMRVGGGNMGLWRETVQALGGFDETFRGAQDNDLALKLLKAGHKIYFEPRAVVVHLPEEGNLRWLCRHATIYGRASLALIERHPDYYGWERLKRLWRHRLLFLLWTPLKAIHQTWTVFRENPPWCRYLYVWPAVWLFYFVRRVAIARGVHELLRNDREAPRAGRTEN